MTKIIRVEDCWDCPRKNSSCKVKDLRLFPGMAKTPIPPNCPLEDAPGTVKENLTVECSVCHEPTPNYVFQSGMAFCHKCYNNAMALRNMVANAMNEPLDIEEAIADLPRR